jgi:hypothetical protein
MGAVSKASSTGIPGDRAIRICPVLGFTSPSLSSRAKSLVYYPLLSPANRVVHCRILHPKAPTEALLSVNGCSIVVAQG